MERGLTRRQFLQSTAVATALVATGLAAESCGEDDGGAPMFLTTSQRATLGAAAERILPDSHRGGVVEYVEQLLTAFEYDPPRIFAGGPFSGRQPYGDYGTGQPSADYPANAFERFVPLTRAQEIAWRTRIYGWEGADGAGLNTSVVGETKGLRHTYSDGLTQLDSLSREQYGQSFSALTEEQQDEIMTSADPEFISTLVEHTLEGMFGAPEYGGNRELIGWRETRFEGDSQPLGYSIYDSIDQRYRERTEHPVSTENPDESETPLDDVAIEFVSIIIAGTGGKRFF